MAFKKRAQTWKSQFMTMAREGLQKVKEEVVRYTPSVYSSARVLTDGIRHEVSPGRRCCLAHLRKPAIRIQMT